MDKLINLFKVLSDETRLRILVLLYHRNLCVCQLQGIMNESQPKISKHLAKLRDMGFVKDERQEQFVFYYLDKTNNTLGMLVKTILSDIKEYPVLGKDISQLGDADKYVEMKKKQSCC